MQGVIKKMTEGNSFLNKLCRIRKIRHLIPLCLVYRTILFEVNYSSNYLSRGKNGENQVICKKTFSTSQTVEIVENSATNAVETRRSTVL